MSLKDSDAGRSLKKIDPDTVKKLNSIFSSYIDGEQSGEAELLQSDKISVEEYLHLAPTEEQIKIPDHIQYLKKIVDVPCNNTISVDNSFSNAYTGTSNEDTDKEYTGNEGRGNEEVNNDVPLGAQKELPSIIYEAFEDPAYQSVDIEDDIDQNKADKVKEQSSIKSTTLKKILKGRTHEEPETASGHHKNIGYSNGAPGKSFNEKDDIHFKQTSSQNFQTKGYDNNKLNKQGILNNSKDISFDQKRADEQEKKEGNINSYASATNASWMDATINAPEAKKAERTKIARDHSLKSGKARKEHRSKNIISTTTNAYAPTVFPKYPAKIAFLYDKDHVFHDASSLSINIHEKPERLIKAMWYLEKNKVLTDGTCTLIQDISMADEKHILRVHDGSYVSFIRSYSESGGGFLGDSTYINSSSYDVARMAAGAAIMAGELVVTKKFLHAFVFSRPPGHHASFSKYGGFCLFNNAAILARYFQQEKKMGNVMIIDWDAHAGDGTMDIFYDDPSVMFVSMHRDPHMFYPRKGFSTQVGEGAGKGYTLNIEMPSGAGNEEYSLAVDELLIPVFDQFSPDVIIISCGFDAYYREKNVGLTLDSQGYHQMTSRICSAFKGPIIFIMEGGYHDFNGQLCHSVLNSIHGRKNPVNDKQNISSYQKNQNKQIFEKMQKKIAEARKNSPVLSQKVVI